jgi:hypothetical protein
MLECLCKKIQAKQARRRYANMSNPGYPGNHYSLISQFRRKGLSGSMEISVVFVEKSLRDFSTNTTPIPKEPPASTGPARLKPPVVSYVYKVKSVSSI